MTFSPISLILELDKQLDIDDLDEFRDIVSASLRRREVGLQEDAKLLKDMDEERNMYADAFESKIESRWSLVNDIKELSGQLTIVALFRQVELHTKRIVKKKLPWVDASSLFSLKAFRTLLPFEIDALPGFNAFNELRLLNNAAKHQGKVTKELSKAFPLWPLDQDLSELDNAYDRLKVEVAEYVAQFVSECYRHAQSPKA